MALEIIWSKRAAKGYAQILTYLDINWTKKEVSNFEAEMKSYLDGLSNHPFLLQESKRKNLRRGPINKHTILTYRVNNKENRIELINIRGSKQKP